MWTGSTFTNLNSMHGDSGQLSLILIQYTVTLVSGSLLIIEKMKVLIIFVTLVYFAFSCEECDYPFSNYATCTGETVCVYGAENVQVECWMRDITTDTVIKQLFVRGDCNILHFKQFCSRGVEIIEMVNSNDNLSCSGNPPPFFPLIFLFLAKGYVIHSDVEFIVRSHLQSHGC